MLLFTTKAPNTGAAWPSRVYDHQRRAKVETIKHKHPCTSTRRGYYTTPTTTFQAWSDTAIYGACKGFHLLCAFLFGAFDGWRSRFERPFYAAPASYLKGGKAMPDYEKMYFMLAAKIADAIEVLDKTSRDLKIIQIEAEDIYIDSENETG